jgi:hypothetical protein
LTGPLGAFVEVPMRTEIIMVAAAVTAGLFLSVAGPSVVSATTGDSQLFCLPMSVIVKDVEKPALQLTGARVSVLALTLGRSARSAPASVARGMRDLASFYKAVAAATTDDARGKIASTRMTKFTKAQKTVAAFYATHCVRAPVTPSLPGVSAASQVACTSDVETLKLAETEFSAVTGGYATMDELVGQRLIKAPSVLHPAITVDSPPGGYTLIGNRSCNDLPVAG